MTQKDKQWVFEQIKEHRVKFIEIWFCDIHGTLKKFTIGEDELKTAFEEGAGFDGSSIKGFTRIEESDMVAYPEPATFAILPWNTGPHKIARMFAEIRYPNGELFDGDPRYALKKNLEKIAPKKWVFNTGTEIEYFYFKSPLKPEPLDFAGYFDAIPRDEALDVKYETELAIEQMGLPIECTHHEVAISQHEIDLRYMDALSIADAIMTTRYVVKEIARKHNIYATFMPKPINGQNGSGMHTHISIFQGDKNLFYDPEDQYKLSAFAKKFIAGLLRHSKEICLAISPTVNSYKRLIPGYEAPVYITWACVNRSDMIRVPSFRKEKSARIEYRAPDPSCNPYLAFSAILVAGLEGVENNYQLAPPTEENVYHMNPAERAKLGIQELPGSLIEAIHFAEEGYVLRKALGEHIFTNLIESKKIEWDRFRCHVTQYEIDTYLPIL